MYSYAMIVKLLMSMGLSRFKADKVAATECGKFASAHNIYYYPVFARIFPESLVADMVDGLKVEHNFDDDMEVSK